MKETINIKKGLFSLSPLLVFLLFYVGMSIWSGDFYSTPIIVAFLLASLYSILTLRGRTIEERFAVLARGAAAEGFQTMIWIFVLAGAFAATAKAAGAIDATVNLTLNLLPGNMLLCGLFIASCFVSLSIGTSVGTIAALTPIACGLTEKTDVALPLFVATVVGGAYFGDNLSFISDTTIMATKTQGCEMKDKFRFNILIAIPAALLCLAVYAFIGWNTHCQMQSAGLEPLLIMPYIFIIAAALMGMNVILLLASGTLMAGAIGMYDGAFDLQGLISSANSGIMNMSELIIVTLLAAGMMESIRVTGGIQFIMQRISSIVKGRRGAELSIAFLVMLTDFCTANNTIAILSVGPLAREISCKYGIDPRRSASLLDTFSCLAQGIIPYGAQMLIASGLAMLNPLDIIPYLFYPFALGLIALIYIFTKK